MLVSRMTQEAEKIGVVSLAPTKKMYSTDNAAMIGIAAALAYREYPDGPPADWIIGSGSDLGGR